jgi:hypothetical protein
LTSDLKTEALMSIGLAWHTIWLLQMRKTTTGFLSFTGVSDHSIFMTSYSDHSPVITHSCSLIVQGVHPELWQQRSIAQKYVFRLYFLMFVVAKLTVLGLWRRTLNALEQEFESRGVPPRYK